MTDELKQCPFCGSNNIIKYSEGDYGYLDVIECQGCGIQFLKPSIDEREIIESWNRRV